MRPSAGTEEGKGCVLLWNRRSMPKLHSSGRYRRSKVLRTNISRNAMDFFSAILKAAPWRVLCCAAAVVASGCSGPASSQRDAPPPPVSAVSYDGHYAGTVSVAAVSFGTDPQTCAVDPQFAMDVTNNAFVYVQPHPKIAGTAP